MTALPPALGQLQHLTYLDLSHNRLTALPPALGQLQSLDLLNLFSNQLTEVPPEIGQLTRLDRLYLNGNQLTALPPELGQLHNLTELRLNHNRLTALPPELGQLQKLTRLDLRANPLTGCLPGAWRDQGIRIQPPEHPPFCTGGAVRGRSAAVPTITPAPTGPPTPTVTPTATATPIITPSAQVEGVYANLEVHQGGSYRLRRRGDLVEATLVSTSSAVQHAARQQPQVLFTLPPEFRPPFPILRRVVGQPVLADGSPDPASPDPRPFRLQMEPDGRVRYLDHPDVEGVGYLAYSLHLTWGTTPAANDLAVLQLLRATMAGTWQAEGVAYEDGRVTGLRQDYLHGPIPPELGELSQLQTLSMAFHPIKEPQDKVLTGPIPPELSQLQNLTSLYLSNNRLTGPIPPELGQLQNLTYLNLSYTLLGGPIPPELGQLQNLRWLYLEGNQLTELPPEFGQLQNLSFVELGDNPWTGCLPAAWRDLGIQFGLHGTSLIPPFCAP